AGLGTPVLPAEPDKPEAHELIGPPLGLDGAPSSARRHHMPEFVEQGVTKLGISLIGSQPDHAGERESSAFGHGPPPEELHLERPHLRQFSLERRDDSPDDLLPDQPRANLPKARRGEVAKVALLTRLTQPLICEGVRGAREDLMPVDV